LPGATRRLESGATGAQELLAFGVGPASWSDYETAQQFSNEDLQRLTEKRRAYYASIERPMPEPMAKAAYYGIAGKIVDIITAQSEACPESILVQFLVGFGNLIGRKPYCRQASVHHLNEFAVLIGETATGCKGISWDAVCELLRAVDSNWFDNRVIGGFQSGESIVYEVRDASTKISRGGKTLVDSGVADKRLAILEEEFGRLLTVANRQGNTLSPVFRDIWDGRCILRSISKTDPQQATEAHISLVGHITPKELRDKLSEIDSTNGFANRILWVAVKGIKILAIPPVIDWAKDHPGLVRELQGIMVNFQARPTTRLEWNSEGELAWAQYYREMKGRKLFGLVGPIIKRSIPHTLRLTGIYTILDNAIGMGAEQLAAAEAVVDYSERSAQWAFQQSTGDKDADRALWALEREPPGLTRTEITKEVFGGNRSATEISMKLAFLRDNDLADFRVEQRVAGHKPAEVWFAKSHGQQNP
jgi:hypothetical protein